MAHIDDILDEYDDLTGDVSRSGHTFFCANLRRWFAFIDKTPELKATVDNAERSIDFTEWRATGLVEQRGMGPGRIVLPESDLQRLGALIGLFRSLTETEQAAWRFAHSYVSTERRLDDNIADLVNHLFEPFARDLRRQIKREWTEPQTAPPYPIPAPTAPASDRIVPLNHNSEEYQEMIRAIDAAEQAIRGLNSYPDPEEKEQRLAEVRAGKTLLEATRARLDAVRATILAALTYLADKVMDNVVAIVITAAVTAIATYFGFPS